ncbi:MAG: cytochrome c oxidase assembly protein [Thiotrichaceae bacterium]
MSQKDRQKISKSFWVKLGLVPIGMFAFAFALVPLYTVFCEITGLNGKTNGASYDVVTQYDVDQNRKVTVDFLAATAPGFPVKFYPKIKNMEVIPGKMYTIKYIAENRSDTVITGQAVPSVAPGHAAQYFKKIECFCFTNQTFQPKVPIEMPVSFIVEPALDKSVVNITLSYNFFRIKGTDQVESSEHVKAKSVQPNRSTKVTKG